MSNISIVIPSKDEQKSIANILETWEIAIEKVEDLIAAEERRLDWLVTHLIKDYTEKVNLNIFCKITTGKKDK